MKQNQLRFFIGAGFVSFKGHFSESIKIFKLRIPDHNGLSYFNDSVLLTFRQFLLFPEWFQTGAAAARKWNIISAVYFQC